MQKPVLHPPAALKTCSKCSFTPCKLRFFARFCLAGGHNPNFCIRLFREIPFGHGAGRFRFGIEIAQIEMEQVMVESFDATPCYLGPQFVVKTLRELRWRIDDGIQLRKNQSEIAGAVSIRNAIGIISFCFSRF